MDGNNSAKRMDHAGHADRRIFPSTYMISRAEVDMFKEMCAHDRVSVAMPSSVKVVVLTHGRPLVQWMKILSRCLNKPASSFLPVDMASY